MLINEALSSRLLIESNYTTYFGKLFHILTTREQNEYFYTRKFLLFAFISLFIASDTVLLFCKNAQRLTAISGRRSSA